MWEKNCILVVIDELVKFTKKEAVVRATVQLQWPFFSTEIWSITYGIFNAYILCGVCILNLILFVNILSKITAFGWVLTITADTQLGPTRASVWWVGSHGAVTSCLPTPVTIWYYHSWKSRTGNCNVAYRHTQIRQVSTMRKGHNARNDWASAYIALLTT